MGVLTIYLDRITNLADADYIGKSDPYVLFELEQDNWIMDKKFGSQRSSTKNNNLNPVYGETYHFTIPTLENMVLTAKIRDEDVGSRDDKLGWCKIKLNEMGLTQTPKAIEKVVDRNMIGANGTIYMKISYKA